MCSVLTERTVWMAPAHALSTGLGIESEGLELPLDELPPWEESRVKIFPLVSKRNGLRHETTNLLIPTEIDMEESRYWRPPLPSSSLRCF